MRAGLSSIQQNLTPEAATVVNQSISEARQRNHGQTTPLHVAETLLSSPSGFLRQACIRSHPNSSHPLKCRALELCFSVALERLTTTAQNSPEIDPPISHALNAALKRAQAHQRRGCPEQPLLAVKVELEQLIISILDDPSVSRVMREASYSSPAVKATIEQSLNNNSNKSSSNHQPHDHLIFSGTAPRMVSNSSNHRDLYLNPRLQSTGHRGEEVKKVMEIMARSKRRNPVLVGDSELDSVIKEVLRKIEGMEFQVNGILKNVNVVSMDRGALSDKNRIATKIKELARVIENKIGSGEGVVLDLGDLKWLVEQPASFGGLETGKAVVAEMAKLLARFGGGNCGNEDDNSSSNGRLLLIGTATCETYLRCQVYHSTMENDWDLQAVPVASRSPLPEMFPRISSNPLEALNPLKTVPTPLPALPRRAFENYDPTPLPALTRRESENSDTGQKPTFCLQCSQNYEKEVAKLTAIEKSFSAAKQDSTLPQWLQNVKLNSSGTKISDQPQEKDQGQLSTQKTQALQKKWRDTCLHLHPNFHQNTHLNRPGPLALSVPSLNNINLLSRPLLQPKFPASKPHGEALQLNMNRVTSLPPECVNSPPQSPVRTDLGLGRKETEPTPERAAEDQAQDFLSCISSEPQKKLLDKFANALDADTYKKLLKGLMEKAWWQAEAASAVASAVTQCSLGNGKRRGNGSRGDAWLLFAGPDRVGKKQMASVLADQICGASLVMICLGKRRDDETSNINFRGKTAIDRIAEAVRSNPFSVIMLEDIDEADILVRGSIKRAIERGRLTDSHGREIGLGNAIFILTGDWSTSNPEALRDGRYVDEKKLTSIASGNWQLGLIVREKTAKRRPNWLHDGNRPLKLRKEMVSGISLDLNLAVADEEDGQTDGSHDSSDLTVDHEDELALTNQQFSATSVPHDLADNVDDSIVFKPVDSAFVREEIKKTIAVKFSMLVDENLSIEVEDDVLEKIMGGLWHDRTSLEEWIEKVLAPSFDQLKGRLPSGDRSSAVVRLVVESNGGDWEKMNRNEDWLRSRILV